MRNPWIVRHAVVLLAGLLLAGPVPAELKRTTAPESAAVYFISPADGEVISGPVIVRMGLRGMGVAPAGADLPNTGHHHLLVNLPLDQVDLGQPLPFGEHTRHFGGGQTEGVLDLMPGEYRLQLVFMDYRHISFDPPVVSATITITVE